MTILEHGDRRSATASTARCRRGSASPTGSRSPATILRNVAFLIIDDSQLTFPQVPGGYDIKAIVGLPVMRALGRMRMEAGAVLGAGTGGRPRPARPICAASGNQLYVDAGDRRAAGAAPCSTPAPTRPALSALYAEADAGADRRRSPTAPGAPGERGRRAGAPDRGPGPTRRSSSAGRRARPAAACRCGLAERGGPSARDYGTIGSMSCAAFESYTLDFRTRCASSSASRSGRRLEREIGGELGEALLRRSCGG